MPRAKAAGTAVERRVWDLLTRDFDWRMPDGFPVGVYNERGAPVTSSTRFQIFEVAVAAVFARLRPDYEWQVSANRPDDGMDFMGRNRFLSDATLGIAAAITVGGQCKKRTQVGDVVEAIAGSLTNMVVVHDPTFFVVAFSARLTPRRVVRARMRIEEALRRHCHILDRSQLEGLFRGHLTVVDQILRVALNDSEAAEVIGYFESLPQAVPSESISVVKPDRVLAGVPLRATVSLRSSMATGLGTRVRWQPTPTPDNPDGVVTLIGPIGADLPAGAEFSSDNATDDPMLRRCSFELVSFSLGDVDLGEVLIGREAGRGVDVFDRISLGRVQVVENVRPRFFDRPFRANLTRLEEAYTEASAGGSACIALVGTGGSGKSRLCEEFCLDKRRRGAAVVVASQAKTLDDPHRVLAELLLGLADAEVTAGDPAHGVIQAVERYDRDLAANAELAIRSVFGSVVHDSSGSSTEQSLVSALLVLLLTRRRCAPLVVHLQDLHWCSADALLLLDRLVWQLRTIDGAKGSTRGSNCGVLFLFEGRIHELQRLGDETWTSEPFEAFLGKLDCATVQCSDFSPEDGLEFIRRLFERRDSTRRLVDAGLLDLQNDLIERVQRASGGNPFHSLEHVRMLRERRVVAQNPHTGFLYMIQPEPADVTLPDEVFESIRLRWQYLRARAPELALLLWAASLLEDRMETRLFQRLRRGLAPDVAVRDVDATDVLWTGDGRAGEVVFRHENYFESLRQFDVAAEDRERVVGVYVDWFASLARPGPLNEFRWGRVLLESLDPDVAQAQILFAKALRGARRRGDVQMARRIAAASLDLTWAEDLRAPLGARAFARQYDRDLELTWDLVGSDRLQAARRLERIRDRVQGRRSSSTRPSRATEELQRRQLEAEVLRSELLFNDRQPAAASDVAARAVRSIQALRSNDRLADVAAWDALEVEAIRTQAVALALSGEIDSALLQSERVLEVARRSSSVQSLKAVSTHANILLARDPEASEAILRACLDDVRVEPRSRELWSSVNLNLSMALLLRAHRLGGATPDVLRLLDEADERLADVFTVSFRQGQHPDAGAAALLRGIVSVVRDDGADVSWFAQAVASAARGRQMETLWRSHINLASALYRREAIVTEGVQDHARAALEIMADTLSPYAQPDRSPRFRLLAVPLAHAVRFLILAGDEAGLAALERYPGLRRCFRDPVRGVLDEDRGGHRSHEWLRVGADDYVIY